MTATPYAEHVVVDRVRRRSVQERAHPSAIIAEELEAGYFGANPAELATMAEGVRNDVLGFGALQPYLDDPSVEEIWINSPTHIFVARAGLSERLNLELSAEAVRGLVERMLRPTGRRIDVSQPFADASLPDGSRLHVAIPDITRRHWSVNIRKFAASIRSLSHLVDAGALSVDAADFLHDAVGAGKSILVSGATQAGKTTVLNALLDAVPARERIVTVEETFELSLDREDVVGLQCRGPSLEGTGEVTLRRLVKEALRMRPDRIVVGEVRGAEALDLLIALNSGLPGMCSIHAKSAEQALVKLATLPLLEGRNIDASFVLPTVAGTIDVVVHLERSASGHRRLRQIVKPTGEVIDGVIASVAVFELQGDHAVATGAR